MFLQKAGNRPSVFFTIRLFFFFFFFFSFFFIRDEESTFVVWIMQGVWFIKAKIDGQTEMKTIQVSEYVLPKFSLSINKPEVILSNAASIPIEFCAR